MRFACSLAAQAVLLAIFQTSAHAVPAVNVELRTAFEAPPYLIELLETAANENATSYFPLLDKIAQGYFDSASTDRELYEKFRAVLHGDRHLGGEDLSTFDYALSIHSAAPRIETHYQYYNNSIAPSLSAQDETTCSTWLHVPFSGQRFCSPELSSNNAQPYGAAGEKTSTLPFDRILGDATAERTSVLYADLMSPSFRSFHHVLSKMARDGQTSYRVRYKVSAGRTRPLAVSGYGIELALKRTDYIVIDDRTTEDLPRDNVKEATLNEEEVSDLRPLSSSEVARLGMKAASFVLESDTPFDTLLRLTQDFPKHSGSIAATNISREFSFEHRRNREILLPPGYNVMWINGVQIMPRDLDAYALLEYLRRERKLISGVREIGLTGPEAIKLLSHEAITASHLSQDVPRYDWRDETEGGNVIIWMNDIEKDKRYADWPANVNALLQRVYPGQLPLVRRDMHNVIIPVNFASPTDVGFLLDDIQNFVKRRVAIRFGLVPKFKTPDSRSQAKIVYYLIERHGLAAALDYLERSLASSGRKFGAPEEKHFTKVVQDRAVRRDQNVLSFQDLHTDAELDSRIKSAQTYVSRLGGTEPPILTNGVPMAHTDEWIQVMSQRVGLDLRTLQQALVEGQISDASYLPDVFLATASLRRNPLILPEDEKEIRHISIGEHPEFALLPSTPFSADTIERELGHLVVAADLDSEEGFEQLMEALLFQREHDNVEVALLYVPPTSSPSMRLGSLYKKSFGEELLAQFDRASSDVVTDTQSELDFAARQNVYKTLYTSAASASSVEIDEQVHTMWAPFRRILTTSGMTPGQQGLILNGRLVGPAPAGTTLQKADLETLLAFERKKRLLPAASAIEGMNLKDRASTPLAFARISNLIALSHISDVPEGIFEAAPTVRTDLFTQWQSQHTAIKVGDSSSATIQIYASIDPASEVAQRWIPIIKVLSELDGVHLSLFLNPKERLDELPVKRFYRQVLSSKPTFDEHGALTALGAHFKGLPSEALLNMGMDLPPSWLVAPKVTVHDLDNIKLSAIKSGADIDAILELEHILIEGHSRDVTNGPPPRGVQLVLGTDLEPHSADTIIMANLGYFQFKANPGIYNLTLQEGRSDEVFKIDSAGSLGYSAQPGDEVTEIALMSFRGVTLFPRLSRKPGMEDEDVLEASKSALEALAGGADKLLAQAGVDASKYLAKAAKFGSSLLSGSSTAHVAASNHADINIFSVASGHLYERMLNIMMVSVMKHTKHTVKFWFIEQFLSPSFKDFLPVMAKEYGFEYEMVTYKWPHWLRAQKEKQREIWGYKILFLDVLFPLDLDKVIFVDADQIVRTDMYELVQHDLQGAPYGFTPMCDSRTEMEGFRFWKQGYWKKFLQGLPYHISALYVVDLKKFRQIAAGDRLRGNYHALSADPNSLSNLDQDLPNHMQSMLPIHSLPQEWLWCETWCSDESQKDAKTIDLCNNPQTKEPKLDRARRQVPEWTVYDDEIAAVAKRHKDELRKRTSDADDLVSPGVPNGEEESIQERLQREDADRERKKKEYEVPEHNEL